MINNNNSPKDQKTKLDENQLKTGGMGVKSFISVNEDGTDNANQLKTGGMGVKSFISIDDNNQNPKIKPFDDHTSLQTASTTYGSAQLGTGGTDNSISYDASKQDAKIEPFHDENTFQPEYETILAGEGNNLPIE
jgi:hypothetical protein